MRASHAGPAVVVILALAVYANSLGNGFVWDDRLLIVENREIERWSNLPRLLSGDFFSQTQTGDKYGYYRPLITLSYMVDHALWGLRPFGYHLTNLLFHIASTLLVYLITAELLGSGLTPFLAASIFALHPIHTESVTWIAGRTDVIATAFVLLSFFLYLRCRGSLSRGGLLAFGLALLAKEVALVFPLLLLLYESLFEPPAWRERLGRILPYVAAVGVYLFFRFGVLGVSAPNNSSLQARGPFRLLLTFVEAIWIYAGKLLLPVNLSAYYTMPVAASPVEPAVLISLAAALGTGAILWLIRRREPAIVFSLLFFVIALLPVSNLLPASAPADMGFFMAERFLYLPSMGFALFLALLLSKGWQRLHHHPERILAGLLVVFLGLFYTATTVRRNQVWRDSMTFHRETLKQAPFSPLLHYNLGVDYKDRGLLDLAKREWEEALRLELHHVARREWQEQLRRNPAHSQALNNLGNLLFLEGKTPEAIAAWRRAISGDSRNVEAHYNLARALDRAGELKEARDFYRRFLLAAPEVYAKQRASVKSRLEQLDRLLASSDGGRDEEPAAQPPLSGSRGAR